MKKFKKPELLALLVLIIFSIILVWIFYFIQKKQAAELESYYKEESSLMEEEIEKMNEKKSQLEAAISESEQAAEFDFDEDYYKSAGITKTKVNILGQGEVLASFVDNSYSRAEIFKKTDNNLYVGLINEDQGAIGYETFHTVYRMDLETNKVAEIKLQKSLPVATRFQHQRVVGDISADEKMVVYIFDGEVVIEDIYTGSILKQITPGEKFFHVGEATFSPDSQKVAYAVSNSYAPKKGAKTAIFVVDLENPEEQKEVATNSEGGFYLIKRWSDEKEVVFERAEIN